MSLFMFILLPFHSPFSSSAPTLVSISLYKLPVCPLLFVKCCRLTMLVSVSTAAGYYFGGLLLVQQ